MAVLLSRHSNRHISAVSKGFGGNLSVRMGFLDDPYDLLGGQDLSLENFDSSSRHEIREGNTIVLIGTVQCRGGMFQVFWRNLNIFIDGD